MRTRLACIAIVQLLFGWTGLSLGAEPSVGDAAPEFELPGSDGRSHSLAEHKGKRAVVLAWFPKAFTPG